MVRQRAGYGGSGGSDDGDDGATGSDGGDSSDGGSSAEDDDIGSSIPPSQQKRYGEGQYSDGGGSSDGGSSGDSGAGSGGSSGTPANTHRRMEQAQRTRPDSDTSDSDTTPVNTDRRMEQARRTRPDPDDGSAGGGSSDGPPVEDDARPGSGGQETTNRTVVATNVEDARGDVPSRFSRGRVSRGARDAEQEFLENNPEYDEEDVDVDLVETDDGEYAFQADLNESGEEQQQQDAAEDIERQLEEEYGTDFERGEDFTVEQTDDGYEPNFTDWGERRAAAANLDASTYTDVDVGDVRRTEDGWELTDQAATSEDLTRREEVPQEHQGERIAAEVDAYTERTESVATEFEQQVEDEYGVDVERGEDYTIEPTDDGARTQVTEQGMQKLGAAETEAQLGRDAIRATAGTLAGPGVAEAVARSVDRETAQEFSGVDVDPETDIQVEETDDGRRATISEEGAESISEQQRETIQENVIEGLEEETGADLDEDDVAFSQEDGQITGELSEQGEEQVAVDNAPFSDTPVVGGITTSGARVRTRMRQTVEPARDWWDENTPSREDLFGAATVTAPAAAAEPSPLGEVGVGTLVVGGAAAGATAYAGNVALGEEPDAQARVQTPAERIANADVTPSQTSVEADVGDEPVFPTEESVPTEDPMDQPEIPAPAEPASRPFPTGQSVPDEAVQTTREQVPDAGDAAYQQPEIEVDARPDEQTDPRRLNFEQIGAGVIRSGQEEIEEEDDAFRPEITEEDIPTDPWEDAEVREVDERGIGTGPEVAERDRVEPGQRVRTWPGEESMEDEIEQTSELQQQFESEFDAGSQSPTQWTGTSPQAFEEGATDTMAMQDVDALQDAAQAQTVAQQQVQENQLDFQTPGTEGFGFPETAAFAEEPGQGYGYEYQYSNQAQGRLNLPDFDSDTDRDPFQEVEEEEEVFGTGFASAEELAERFEL